jgi:hypothetical protein
MHLPLNPPLRVMLRNKARARLTAGVKDSAFTLLGVLDDEPTRPELWLHCGHWRETKKPHALDIVALVTTDDSLIAFAGLEIVKLKSHPGGAA